MKEEYGDFIDKVNRESSNRDRGINALSMNALFEIATFLERIAIAQERIATMEEESHKRACEYADAMEKGMSEIKGL